MSKFAIQPIIQSHIPLVLDIENSAHVTPWSESVISSSFNKRSHNFGVFSEHELLGYYFCELIAGEMTLHNICVSPSWQGKGIAKQLLKHMFELAENNAAEDCWLEVRKSNVGAIALYEQFGFETQFVRKNYYSLPNSNDKEDALQMKVDFAVIN